MKKRQLPSSSDSDHSKKSRVRPSLDPRQVLIERIEEVMADPDTIAAQPKRLDFIVKVGQPIYKITRSPGRVEIEFSGEIHLTTFYR